MNTKLIIIWIIGIFLGVIVLAMAWYFFFAMSAPTQQPPQSSTSLPMSGTVTPVSPTNDQFSSRTSIATQGGSSVKTNDFIHNGTTIPDTANAGRYLLAGNLGYCPSDPQQCQAAPVTDFAVYYSSKQGAFTIALTEEPIGLARLNAEQFLLTTLGLTEQQMCSLNYYVGTTYWVNAMYDDKNLGFSFCPGATVLPTK